MSALTHENLKSIRIGGYQKRKYFLSQKTTRQKNDGLVV